MSALNAVAPGQNVVQMLVAADPVLAFFLLYQTRILAMIRLQAGQALVLSVLACWLGWVRADGAFFLVAAIALAGRAVAMPLLLRAALPAREGRSEVESGVVVAASMILGLGLVLLAVLAVRPATLGALSGGRAGLAGAVSVLLLGLLAMVARRRALPRLIGFLCVENGFLLAVLVAGGMPMMVVLSAASLLLAGAPVLGVLLFGVGDDLDSPKPPSFDRLALARIRGRRR